MNDKIQLYISNENFKQNNQFDNHFAYKCQTVVLPESEIETKESWFCNSDGFQTDINGFGCRVSFNPNKINGLPYSLNPLPFKTISDTFDIIEADLHCIGIDANLKSARIARFDNSFDLPISQKYSEYEPLIKSLATNVKPLRRGKTTINENSLYVGNKSNEICIYDKTTEATLTENIVRIEFRHLKTAKLKLNFNSINEKRYYDLRKKDKNVIVEHIFNKKPILLEDDTIKLLFIMLYAGCNKTQIYKGIAMQALNIRAYDGIINHLLTTTKKNPYYRTMLSIKNDLAKEIILTVDYEQNYNELTTLFKRAS